MFDRWRKLLKAFHNEKKKQYDISKIPDIYDSAKYDAIHNSHLPLDLQPVYKASCTGLAVHNIASVLLWLHNNSCTPVPVFTHTHACTHLSCTCMYASVTQLLQ